MSHSGEPGMTRANLLKKGAAVGAGASVLGVSAAAQARRTRVSGRLASGVKRGGVLRFVNSDYGQNTLEPANSLITNDIVASCCVFETLTYLDPNWKPLPSLAVSWKPNANATVWTVNLRQGVKFHNGKTMDANDVVWSIKRIYDKKLGSPVLARFELVMEASGVTAVNKNTVRFKLKQPDSAFPVALGYRHAAIVPAGTKHADTAAQAIGTGPFKAKSYKIAQSWEVVRNPNYWKKGFPYLDGIQGVVIPDPTTKLQAVASGSAMLTDRVNPTTLRGVANNKNVKLVSLASQFLINAAMDVTKEPFTDPRVVQAVKLAADRSRILQVVGLGYGTVTQDVWVPQSNPYYPPALKANKTNIQKAKDLLSAAGHSNGIEIELVTATSTEFGPELAQALQQVVAPAGINIKINKWPADTFWSDAWLKQPFVTSWWFQRYAPDILALVFKKTASWNESKFDNPAFEKALNQALASTSVAKQTAFYRQALALTANLSGEVLPFFATANFVAKKNINGVIPHKNRFVDFTQTWIA